MHCSVLPAFPFLSLAAGALGCAARHKTGGSTRQIPFGEKIAIEGLSDFGKVDDYLYRGGQPRDEGLDQLQRLGTANGRSKQRTLSQQLQELQTAGIVERTVYPDKPPRVVYAITPLGKTLRPLLDATCY
jgi:hypothetical protein